MGVSMGVVRDVMQQEGIVGFADTVAAPTWIEGATYLIQLAGVGGLKPNTVLVDWPEQWWNNPKKAVEFVRILSVSLSSDKAVLAVKGLNFFPCEPVIGTIDIWWMVHDGGFLILLSWFLVQHRNWRRCHLRVFTICENISAESARYVEETLGGILRSQRIFDISVEVILADDEMAQMAAPYTRDRTARADNRNTYLSKLSQDHRGTRTFEDTIPLTVDALLPSVPEREGVGKHVRFDSTSSRTSTPPPPWASRESFRKYMTHQKNSVQSYSDTTGVTDTGVGVDMGVPITPGDQSLVRSEHFQEQICPTSFTPATVESASEIPPPATPSPRNLPPELGEESAMTPPRAPEAARDGQTGSNGGSVFECYSPLPPRQASMMRTASASANVAEHLERTESFNKLNSIIHSRSRRAQLVVMNLPNFWGADFDNSVRFVGYCETLTRGLERVLFVHSSGHEIFRMN